MLASADSYRFTTDMETDHRPIWACLSAAPAHPGMHLSGEPTMNPDAPLWVSLLLLPALPRGVWRVLRSGDGWLPGHADRQLVCWPSALSCCAPHWRQPRWPPCFYPYLWQGVFAGGWLLCRPRPAGAASSLWCWPATRCPGAGHLGVLAGGLFSQISAMPWYRPAAMTLVFWLASLFFAALSCAQPLQTTPAYRRWPVS